MTEMDEIEWWEFDTPAELAEQVSGDIGFVIESAVQAHGAARIALPGRDGSQSVYRALLAAKGIEWSKVTLVPTHESVGGPSHGEALRALFGAKGAEVVALVDGKGGDSAEAGREADKQLGALQWPLDLVLLAVAPDGRVAGISPGPGMDAAVSGPKGRRAVQTGEGVTLTAPALASARAIMLVLTGAEQRATVERAIKDGPLSALPIGRLLAEIDAAVDIFWSAD
jgi:6-phosphogluconolactonase